MDTRDINTQNLLFLLAAAPLSVGCIITGGDDDTTSTTNSTTDNSETGTPTTSGTTGGTGEMTTGMTGGTTETPADSTTASVDETTEGQTSETGGAPPACLDYADNIIMCYDDKAGQTALEYCAEYYAQLAGYSEDCAAAAAEYYACLSGVSCEVLMGPAEDACPDEFMNLDAICFPK